MNLASINIFEGLSSDGSHCGISDFYPEHEAALRIALESAEPFDTKWYSSKKECLTARISCLEDPEKILIECTAKDLISDSKKIEFGEPEDGMTKIKLALIELASELEKELEYRQRLTYSKQNQMTTLATNAIAIYPETVQNILGSLNAKDSDFGSVWRMISERDRELTKTFTDGDACDFIVMDGQDAFIFIDNGQKGVWTVKRVGQPIYEVEPVIDDVVDFDDTLLAAVQYELGGVEVKKGSARNNANSTFVEYFKNELDRAYSTALESFSL